MLETYNNYLIIGGIPECVASWISHKDPERITQIQRELVEIYENDFSKHNGRVNSGRILMVFRSIVSQLAKSNEKFMYGAVREGGRARDFEEAIEWLVSAGMLTRVRNVSKTEHPPPHLKNILRKIIRLMRYDSQNAGIAKRETLLIFPFISPEKQKSCWDRIAAVCLLAFAAHLLVYVNFDAQTTRLVGI